MTSKINAGVIIKCKDSVVLCKRITKFEGKSVSFGGYWAPFAGMVEEGESEQEAAARELYEESGVKANPKSLIHLATFKKPHLFLYVYEVDDFPEIKLCTEHTDLGYFLIEHLKELPQDYKLDPKIIKSLQAYQKNIPKKD